MPPGTAAYRRRLNLASALLLGALGALPLVLAWGLVGPGAGALFWLAVLAAGLLRPGGDADLPGTLALHPGQAPGLFALVDSLARQAGLGRRPEVRFVPGGQTNAAALLRGRTPVLLVTEALLARLDTRRLAAVLAHETAHLAHGDLTVFRLALTFQAATLVLGVATAGLALIAATWAPTEALPWVVGAALAPSAARLLTAALSRTREFAADLGSARLTGDPAALADALEIIEYRPRTWFDWLWGRRVPRPSDPSGAAFRTHPPTAERIRRLDLLAGLG